MAYETIIGLEIHVELDTKSKIFCSCSTKFGAEPNENTCPICTGLPGTLPVLNEEVVNLAIKAGNALNCEINKINKTDRKNYFYPDLPKAFQISQFDMPICSKGFVEIEVYGEPKRINITRIHIEEDAGKLIHLEDEPFTLVDYNRTGVPLIEIVTEPDLRSAKEAVAFLKTLKSILQYAGISDCRMEQGSLRCDANISIREIGSEEYNTKVEIKNLNSFKEVGKALEKEERRQKELYSFGEGNKIKQETRKWDAGKGRTIPMRSKEDAHDYRYFPEPDLPPVFIKEELIKEIGNTLPELAKEKSRRFMKQYGLKEKEVEILVSHKELADYFEEVVKFNCKPKDASNWITVEVMRAIKETEIIPIKAEYLAKLINLVDKGTISRLAAKEVFREMMESKGDPENIVMKKGLLQINGEDVLEEIIKNVLSQNPKAVEDFTNGKDKAVGYLVGQIMKETKGKANPSIAKEMLIKKLKEI
ncbi:Asp-tRNA(Asn)/Glu-tRNA(Gln) amidotransferase subunit GatB [Wukongibacter sp. M2B1]|uniref:Asp-tRNA(Asn)/Glu-tRNA(Gln) amidotransferase subunit GatB n=1 Tax=Wukongibacter sp. M2B1 TaxID=3088895 RepID=UPI003D79214A